MAQSRFIQSVLDAARQEAGASGVKSINWFKGKINDFGKPGPQELIRDGRRTKGVNLGHSTCLYILQSTETHSHIMTPFH